MTSEIQVLLEAIVNPTEDVERLKIAFANIIEHPSFELVSEGDRAILRGTVEGERSLAKLRNILHQDRILAAARKVLLHGVRANEIRFYLNRQVAYVGHVSFCKPQGESPLGPIEVRILAEDPKALIDWLAPVTFR